MLSSVKNTECSCRHSPPRKVFRSLRRATRDAVPRPCKLLKKLEQNFSLSKISFNSLISKSVRSAANSLSCFCRASRSERGRERTAAAHRRLRCRGVVIFSLFLSLSRPQNDMLQFLSQSLCMRPLMPSV